MKAAVLCVLTLAGLAPSAVAARPDSAVCTAPPVPGGTTRTVPAGHAKSSALAPHPRSHERVYGAPIPRPIVSKHVKRPRRAPATAPASSR
jgi:hypothetical protein